jgi:TolB-like protein
MEPPNTAFSADSVLRELARIQSHPLFVRSARLCRFLQFTIERHLRGRTDELKEYVLGVEVFDRPPAHDPRLDPIVRVEARRLRAKLRAFYQSDGAGDDLIIDYPRGSYVPEFRWRSAAGGGSEAPALIAVLPFSAHSQCSCAGFAEGLTREVIHELDQTPAVRVFSARNRGPAQIDALLTGTVRRAGPRLRVTAELLSPASTRNLWSADFESAPSNPLTAQKQIAFATAHALSLHFRGR